MAQPVPKNVVRIPNDSLFDKIQAGNNVASKNASQMSGLSGMGESQEDADKRDAAAKLAQEKIQANVKGLQTGIRKIAKLAADAKAEPERALRLKKLTLAKRAIEKLQDLPKEDRVRGQIPILSKMMNEIVSAREHVFANEGRRVKISIDACLEAPTLADSLGQVTAKKNMEAAPEIPDSAAESFKKYQGFATKAELGNRPYVIARLPIVAIADPSVSASALAEQGMDVENTAGYAVLKNQMAIGISKKLLDPHEKAAGAAERILRMVRKQSGKKLQFVTDEASPHGGGIWYWVAEQRDIDRMMKAARGRLNIQRWGFSF